MKCQLRGQLLHSKLKWAPQVKHALLVAEEEVHRTAHFPWSVSRVASLSLDTFAKCPSTTLCGRTTTSIFDLADQQRPAA